MKPCLYIIFLLLFSLVACTDYVEQIDERIEERNAHEQARDESKIPVSEVFVDSASVFFGSFEDARDGRRYKTVTIGMLTWMAENLNYETEGGYCYDADIENCAKYGRLYTWAAAMDSAGVWSENGKGCGYGKLCAPTYPVKGVCPDEWHLPSYGEWMTLFSSVDTDPDASLFMLSGSVLKSRSGWDQENNEDTYGFSVLPAGAWMEVDERGALFYSGMEFAAYFWMATEETRDDAYSFYIDSNSPHRDIASKEYGYSVRCVKNVTDERPEPEPETESETRSPAPYVEPCRMDTSDVCEYGAIEDSRDGKSYRTVTIGTHVWMAENLNYETNGGYCYDDADSNCFIFGRLYTWAAAIDSVGDFSDDALDCGKGKTCRLTRQVRGICPEGWRIPTNDDWSDLFDAVGGESTAGMMLRSTSGWFKDSEHNNNGVDAYGFSAIPAGVWDDYEHFYIENGPIFWSSTEFDSDKAYRARLYLYESDLNGGENDWDGYSAGKSARFSVRCVKDVADKKAEKDSSSQTLESSESDESSSSAIEYGTLVDSRDGRTYKTVTIGTQVWMAENLSYDAQYSICRDDPDDCEKYGRYYTWAIAMDSIGEFSDNGLGCGYDTICEPTYPVRGICPEGWHLPRGSEYWTLIETVGGESAAAEKLKSTSGWDYFENGVDTYGFNILPAGGCGYDGCGDVGGSATFWTSDGQKESGLSGIFGLEADYGLAYTTDESRYYGKSVRCVED